MLYNFSNALVFAFSLLFSIFFIVNTIQNIKDISFNKTKMFRIYNGELRLNENFEIAEEATLTVFGLYNIL